MSKLMQLLMRQEVHTRKGRYACATPGCQYATSNNDIAYCRFCSGRTIGWGMRNRRRTGTTVAVVTLDNGCNPLTVATK